MSRITLTPPTSAKRRARAIAVVAACGALVAACGASSSSADNGASSSTNGGASNPNPPSGFQPVAGKVVSVGTSGARISTTSGKANVAFASSTRFTSIAAISRSALKVGDCVMATSKSSTSGSTSPITATSIIVTSSSACTQARGFGNGAGGFAAPTGAPSGAPSGAPGGAPNGGEGFSGGTPPGGTGSTSGYPQRFRGRSSGAAGTVTAVTGSSVKVKALFSPGRSAGAGATSTPVTIETSSSTTYHSRSTATATDVVTGKCLTAVGQKASNGVVDAFMVTVSSPTNGICAASSDGFGGGFGFGGRPPAAAGGAQPGGTTNG